MILEATNFVILVLMFAESASLSVAAAFCSKPHSPFRGWLWGAESVLDGIFTSSGSFLGVTGHIWGPVTLRLDSLLLPS